MHWIFSLEGGPKRSCPAAVLIGDKIFSFGGESQCETERPIDVFILDCFSFRWRKLDHEEPWLNAPCERYWHTAVGFEGKAYIWGGRKDNENLASNELHEYDSTKNSWRIVESSGLAPLQLMGHSACVIHDKMLIFGGMDSVGLINFETFSFHFPTATWSCIPVVGEATIFPLLSPAVAIGNRMFVIDGIQKMELKCLDLDKGSWHKPLVKSALPQGRRGHSTWVHNGKIYIFGGYDLKTKEVFNGVFEFDPEQSLWREIQTFGEKPQPSSLQCCVKKNQRIFLFGGANWFEQIVFSDLHVLDYAPSLRTLCIMNIKKQCLSSQQLSLLPRDLQLDVLAMWKPNRISDSEREG